MTRLLLLLPLLLVACSIAPSDPLTARAWADGALSATEYAVVDRAQLATLEGQRTQSALIAQQTQAAMQATATNQERAAQSTQVSAQHTAVMEALQATQDYYVVGMRHDARIKEEFARQTEAALIATATQGAIVGATRRQANLTGVIVYVMWSLSCLSSLALAAVISLKWLRQVKEINRPLYRPLPPIPPAPVVERLPERARTPEDDTHAELGKIILRSAGVHGWDSNQIAGHRDLEIGAGKWHRIISSVRGYVEADNRGTRVIEGTLREFYNDLEAGRINIERTN